jgi:hypothetical protein
MSTEPAWSEAPSGPGERLARLASRAPDLGLDQEDAFPWTRRAAPPLWLSRQSYGQVIADLRYGELVTAMACERMMGILPEEEARACLARQHHDEQVHGRLYERYLACLGVEGTAAPGLQEAYERSLSWQGDPLGLVLAFAVVLEGEALRLQHHFAERFPCPLFAELNRKIAADEARHLAFGRIYGREGLRRLDAGERIDLYRWLKSLWWDCARVVRDRYSGLGGRVLRAFHPPLSQSWRRHAAALMDLGLVGADEQERAERP